jgi:hypothetical protein
VCKEGPEGRTKTAKGQANLRKVIMGDVGIRLALWWLFARAFMKVGAFKDRGNRVTALYALAFAYGTRFLQQSSIMVWNVLFKRELKELKFKLSAME